MSYTKSPAAARFQNGINTAGETTLACINATASIAAMSVALVIGTAAGAVGIVVVGVTETSKAAVGGVDRGIYGVLAGTRATRRKATDITDNLRWRLACRAERKAAAKVEAKAAKAALAALAADPALTAFISGTPLPA